MHTKIQKALQNWTVVLSAIIGILGVVISVYVGYLNIAAQITIPIQATQTAEARLTVQASIDTPTPNSTSAITATIISTPVTPVPQAVETQVAMLMIEVTTLQQKVDMLSQQVSNGSSSSKIASLPTDVQAIDERLQVIEQAIVDNPGRALALTLLSRDMENLKDTYQADLESTRQEVSRIYDLNKWFIGLMFTMALGLISLAVSNFLKKPEEHKQQKETVEKKEETPSGQKTV